MLSRVGMTLFALRLLGSVSLSALLITVILSQKLHRHPVFLNFVCTSILYSSLLTYLDIVDIAHPWSDAAIVEGVKLVLNTLVDSLKMTGLVSTLNLVIHLWFAMRTAFHNASLKSESFRTFTLLVSPYLFGIIPICPLFATNTPGYSFAQNFPGYVERSLVIVTTLGDVLLLVTYYKHRRIFRRANMKKIMSLSLLIRLSIFCMFRLIFTVILLVALTHHDPKSFPTMLDVLEVSGTLYSPLAFCLFGLQRDILQVWFPCLKVDTEDVSFKRFQDIEVVDITLTEPTHAETSSIQMDRKSDVSRKCSSVEGDISV